MSTDMAANAWTMTTAAGGLGAAGTAVGIAPTSMDTINISIGSATDACIGGGWPYYHDHSCPCCRPAPTCYPVYYPIYYPALPPPIDYERLASEIVRKLGSELGITKDQLADVILSKLRGA